MIFVLSQRFCEIMSMTIVVHKSINKIGKKTDRQLMPPPPCRSAYWKKNLSSSSSIIVGEKAAAPMRDDSLRDQLNRVIHAKKQLIIKQEHWERIKRITKNPNEVRDIDRKLAEIRMEFLKFGERNF
uniref:Ac29 n=1 Tax=Lymantria dispar multicapsid nuclear polyhedrosis virus TaxID=10449 RepID=A0A1B1MQX4_NPVLD|nr:hypothetical protein [Lymantria dispar multiple nucleopolyhedrovirus]